MSWVTLDRICQEQVDKEGVRSELGRNGRPLRSSAEALSDNELLAKLRDPGGGDAGLAQAIREGLTAAPRYLFCGAALSQTGGHGDPRPPELGCCLGGGHMAEVVDGVDALRRAARERLRSGAHAIKIMASGGFSRRRTRSGCRSTRRRRSAPWPRRRAAAAGTWPPMPTRRRRFRWPW